MKKILVLEDEDNIRSFVVINLRRSGFEPIEAENGTTALEKLKVNPDICLALLDVMLPDIDGFEVCRRIRASGSKIGIIMLTAKSQEIDKVTGLMTGADDYIRSAKSEAQHQKQNAGEKLHPSEAHPDRVSADEALYGKSRQGHVQRGHSDGCMGHGVYRRAQDG